MLFDLHRFLRGEKLPDTVPFSLDLSGYDFADCRVPDPVKGVLTARLVPEGVQLTLTVESTLEGACARCLAPLRQDCCFTREALVRPRDLDDSDRELPLDANGCLDVTEYVYQELFLAIPRVLLCSPDCPGLCPVCGRRKDVCSCPPAAQDGPADDRLSILRQLLQSNFTKEVQEDGSTQEETVQGSPR